MKTYSEMVFRTGMSVILILSAGVALFLAQIITLAERSTLDAARTKPASYYMAVDSGFCQVSYYSSPEHGRPTAFGEIFDSLALTCAIDLNTPIFHNDVLEVSDGARACTVRVNDRMSMETCRRFPERDLDLAQAAAARMHLLDWGVRYMRWRKINGGQAHDF